VRETQVLVKCKDESGTTFRALHLDADGSLIIEGQDVGDGVEAIWGQGVREYEFQRRLEPDAVAQLRAVLGIDAATPLLHGISGRVRTTVELEHLIAAEGIESTFWSRIGD
jgi:hypothetical protein